MDKEIYFKDAALKKIVSGVNKLAATVGSTLGPGGRTVIFENYGYPLVTKDGVTVAERIDVQDKLENIGIQMVKQIAKRTCNDAGDGTTTATILANAILTEGAKHVSSGVNPIDIQRALVKKTDEVISYIEKNIKKDIKSDDEIRDIATLSANWDNEIGKVVSDAIIEVGLNGTIQVEPKNVTSETTLKLIDGINFSRGYRSPYFVNNKKMEWEAEDPFVLLYKGKMSSVNELVDFLTQFNRECNKHSIKAPILIVADDFEPEVIHTLVLNVQRRTINACAIKAPWERDMLDGTMSDLAVFLGGRYYDPLAIDDPMIGKVHISQLTLNDLGRCKKVVVGQQSSAFIEGYGDKQDVENLIEELKIKMLDDDCTEQQAGELKVRISQLTAKVAIINVGSFSDVEANEKKDRIDDALKATRAAISEGIVPGGCYSYLKALSNKNIFKKSYKDEAERLASIILEYALKAPFRKLLSNAGLSDKADILIQKILKSNKKYHGYNVKTDKICDLLKAGVVDPFKVTRSALQNAVSVASLILSSEATIVDIIDGENASAPNNTHGLPSLF